MTATETFSIRGKNAVVTGAAMGIGFAIAKRFVEDGANTILADVNGDAVRGACDKLSKGPGRVASLVLDVSADNAGDTLVEKAIKEFGGLDVLVNNAGVYPQVPLLKMTPDMLDRVLRINLRGLVLVSKAAAIQLVKQGRGGAIINIGSVDSVHPSMVGLAAYDASKGGVLSFTKNLALEVAPHKIRVNAILPGGVTTEGTSSPLEGSGMTAAQLKEFFDRFIQMKIPMGRMGNPDEIATVALFLASPAAAYMTGSAVTVDGGMLLT